MNQGRFWPTLNAFDDKSTLLQVMAWWRQTTSHYVSQCPRTTWTMSPYGVTRPWWVNVSSLQNKCQTAYPDRLNLGRSGKLSFFIIYKFWQNCASVRQVSDLILKTVHQGQVTHILIIICISKLSYHWFISVQSHCLNKWWLNNYDLLIIIPQKQCSQKTFIVHQTFVWWAAYSIQICEISHQTFGPSHRKCLMCPTIFVNIAKTHWGPDKMATFFFCNLTSTFPNSFSCVQKIVIFWFKFHWNLLSGFQSWQLNKPVQV